MWKACPRYRTRTFPINLICDWLYILCYKSLTLVQIENHVFFEGLHSLLLFLDTGMQCHASIQSHNFAYHDHPGNHLESYLLCCEYIIILAAAACMPSMWPGSAMQGALWIFLKRNTSNNHSCDQLDGFLLSEDGTCALCTYVCSLSLLAVHVCWTQPRQEQISCSHNFPQEEFLSRTRSLSLALNQSIPC